MGYTPSHMDPDFWIKQLLDGHYEYIANYVDDVICFSHNWMQVIEEIHSDYVLKGISEPEYYLGGNVEPLDDTWKEGGVSLAILAWTYIKNVVECFESTFGTKFCSLKTPTMTDEIHPETNDTPLLNARGASLYHGLIGSTNWAITLGHFDIQYATLAI